MLACVVRESKLRCRAGAECTVLQKDDHWHDHNAHSRPMWCIRYITWADHMRRTLYTAVGMGVRGWYRASGCFRAVFILVFFLDHSWNGMVIPMLYSCS